ncbi:MAG: hypothetical protein LBK97_02670 [Prevotellaceae bacterium]|nr:hypothetical protein [Prevotellaceae bacterium]
MNRIGIKRFTRFAIHCRSPAKDGISVEITAMVVENPVRDDMLVVEKHLSSGKNLSLCVVSRLRPR